MNLNSSNEQLKTISTATYLEEASQPKLLLTTTVVLAGFVFLAIIWSIFTDVTERALTYGKLMPTSGVQSIQHLEGGIIRKIHVRNGDKVEKGRLLIEMDTTAIHAELSQLHARHASYVLDIERLKAFINWEEPNLEYWLEVLLETVPSMGNSLDDISSPLQDEKTLLLTQNKKRANQLQVIDDQIRQHQQELLKLENETIILKNHFDLLKQELAIYESLIEEGHISRKDYIASQKQLNKATGDIDRLGSQIKKERFALSETVSRRERTISDINEKANQELDQLNAKLMEYQHLVARLNDKLERATVTSPISGIVNGLVLNEGAVGPAGLYLLDIVPLDKDLMVQSRLNPKDIGHVQVGDPVSIKVMTFDFAEFGSIEGVLTNVSATTFDDEQGLPYYKAEVSLHTQLIGDKDKRKLVPGMTVEASIITGEKSVMAYLLKPIRRSMGKSFTER